MVRMSAAESRAVFDDRLRDDLAGLIDGQSLERLHEAERVVAREIDLHPLPRADRFDDDADHVAQLGDVRHLQREADGQRLEVLRQFQRIAGEDDGRARRRQLLRELAQGAADVRIVEMPGHVLEQEDGVGVLDLARCGAARPSASCVPVIGGAVQRD